MQNRSTAALPLEICKVWYMFVLNKYKPDLSIFAVQR